MAALQGLTEQEVIQRRNKGEGNNVELSTSRTYGQILRKNFLNPINLLLFVLAGVMLALGRPSDAISTGGLILLNALIGTEKEVDPSELVRGDVLLANFHHCATILKKVHYGSQEFASKSAGVLRLGAFATRSFLNRNALYLRKNKVTNI